jgi:hypothetical protein
LWQEAEVWKVLPQRRKVTKKISNETAGSLPFFSAAGNYLSFGGAPATAGRQDDS